MKETSALFMTLIGVSLLACGGSDSDSHNVTGTLPGLPGDVAVAPGIDPGTVIVSFSAPNGGASVTSYTATADPGGIEATGTSSPLTLSGLLPKTAYTISVTAGNQAGDSAPATTGLLRFYSVIETFYEPETQPNDTIFTGTFIYDTTSKLVSSLTGLLTESMTGPPMATISLVNQLASTPVTLGGVDGLLVSTFALSTTDTFDPSGFAPGGIQYYGHATGATNPLSGGIGNAYATIFVNTTDPTAELGQAQIDELAYADCTAGGMMGPVCMTGTTVNGYGTLGTMEGYPISEVIEER